MTYIAIPKLDLWCRIRLRGTLSFNPTSLFSGNTGGWWDASDSTTTFQDTAGTVPAVANNDPVARINDKSGNGNNLLQATAGKRPILKTSGGLWWLEFDGVSMSLTASFTYNDPANRIHAIQVIAWTINKYVLDGVNVNNCAILMDTVTPQLSCFAGLVAPSTTDCTVGVNHVLSNVANGASSNIAVDNIAPTSGNSGAGTVKGGVSLGAAGNDTSFSNIRFYAGIDIGRVLTAGESASCRTFFGAKAGLSL